MNGSKTHVYEDSKIHIYKDGIGMNGETHDYGELPQFVAESITLSTFNPSRYEHIKWLVGALKEVRKKWLKAKKRK